MTDVDEDKAYQGPGMKPRTGSTRKKSLKLRETFICGYKWMIPAVSAFFFLCFQSAVSSPGLDMQLLKVLILTKNQMWPSKM